MSDSTEARPSVSAPAAGALPITPEVRAYADGLHQELTDALGVVDDRNEKGLLLHETAEFDERIRLDELASAKGYLTAFNARGQFRPPLFGLIRLYSRRKSLTNLLKLFEALAKIAPNDRERSDALVQRGELLEDRMDDPTGARALFEEAVATDPANRSAWMALERHALRERDPGLLRTALLKIAELTTDLSRKGRILTEVALELAGEGTAEALEEASRLLREVADASVGQWRALVELERFAERTERPADLAYALERRAALAEEIGRGNSSTADSGTFHIKRLQDAEEAQALAADLYARAARIQLTMLGDVEAAFAASQKAIDARPEESRFRVYAMYLADAAGDLPRAAAQAQWLLEKGWGDPTIKSGLHFRIAEAASASGDHTTASESLRQALAINPESAATLTFIVDGYVAAGDGGAAASEYDRLAAGEDNKKRRAALYRTAGMFSLALSSDLNGAARRFRFAAEEDPQDALSRRALVALTSRTTGADAKSLVTTIDELLPMVKDTEEKVCLLFRKHQLERFDLKDLNAAATTMESLARALGNEAWGLESALRLRVSRADFTNAARLAEELYAAADSPEARREWAAVVARMHLAANAEAKVRTFAASHLKEDSADPYVTMLAFRLALLAKEPGAALDVLLKKAETGATASSARWLLVGAVLLSQAGFTEQSRKAMERAAELAPDSPAVRTAMLSATRWRADTALRTRLVEAALDAAEVGDEEIALGTELLLAKVFLEHDAPAAGEVLERVVGRNEGNSLAVALLEAMVLGARHGPDAAETQAALQRVLNAMPGGDPLRPSVELEVARALSSSQDTQDQAREVRELLEGDLGSAVAPRLLALLDAIQREERREVPTTLCRVAEQSDATLAAALRSAALAALRAQGRDDEARALALSFPDLPAGAITLAEMGGSLEHASAKADGLIERMNAAPKEFRADFQRRAATFCSMAGRDDDAIAMVELLIKADPNDLVSWDLLRVTGRRKQKWTRVVDACENIAKRVKDKARASALWEEAGSVYMDQLNNVPKGEFALRKALENDPARLIAYRRLRGILEKRKDFAGLEQLVTTRLEAITDEQELTNLWWEQARLRRALNKKQEALASAVRVVEKQPEHVAALAMMAEVHASSGRLAEAAQALVSLARAGETPKAQRKVARVGAIDIFDLRLKNPGAALDQIDALVEDSEADNKLVERAVDIAARAGLWVRALRFATLAANRAEDPDTRCATLLRVAAIQRDHLNDRKAALETARTAHDVLPYNLDALKTLHDLANDDEKIRRSRSTIEAIREVIRSEGASPEAAQAIDEAAQLGGDPVLGRAAQRVARVLGGSNPVVSVGVPAPRTSLRDPQLILRYRNAEDTGLVASLLDAIMPDMAEMAGVGTDGFNVGRSDRIRGAHPIRDALTPYALTVGYNEFELYHGGNDDTRVAVIPGSPPSIVLGKRIQPPFDDPTRFRIARALLLTARGIGAMQALDAAATAEVVLAALAAADLPITGGTSRFEPRLRPVARALSRRVRKAIAESGKPLAAAPNPYADVWRGACAAFSTARRGALAASGAVSSAFQDLAATDSSDTARQELVLFALSDALASIERELGVDR